MRTCLPGKPATIGGFSDKQGLVLLGIRLTGGKLMARISGVDIPDNKTIGIALTAVYGVGVTRSLEVLETCGIDPQARTRDLSDRELASTRDALQEYTIEGDLRREEAMNIKRLQDIGSYRGRRHRTGLPVRGQRTKTNARTRKGPNRGSGAVKKRK